MEDSRRMHWWIVEDALRGRQGHWFEYLRTFQRGLEAQGDQVHFFASKECTSEVAGLFRAEPVLPKSIWARMSDGAPKWRRLLRIPFHGFATYCAVSKLLAGSSPLHAPSSTLRAGRVTPDLIFVPTVLVHHLAGWLPLVRWKLRNVSTRVLLFFPNTPIKASANGGAHLAGEPTAKLFRWYIRKLAPEVASGKVVLGAETRAMAKALSVVTGVPFVYLPHPVDIAALPTSASGSAISGATGSILCGAYGAARADKQSGLLQKAIRQLLEEWPEVPARFALQWVEDFRDEHGDWVRFDPWLRNHPKVQVIDELFVGEEYLAQLSKTDVLLLPYGSDYRLRVSRVAIEALVQGKPIVVASGTTLEDQQREFGAGVAFDGRLAASLADALKRVVNAADKLGEHACRQALAARDHFSVSAFRALLQESRLTRSDGASEDVGNALSGPCLPRASVNS
jgi:hypothetical protein